MNRSSNIDTTSLKPASSILDNVSSPVSSSSSSSSSVVSSLFSSWQTIVIIILALALLGINVFAYLAEGTQDIVSIFGRILGPILKIFGFQTLTTTKEIVQNTATGTKAGVDIVAVTTTGVINDVIQTAGAKNGSTASVNKALDSSQPTTNINDVQPNDATLSSVHKAGWCYIGEDHGVRACSEVGVNDTCMSGDIFPTQAVCMNPRLRA